MNSGSPFPDHTKITKERLIADLKKLKHLERTYHHPGLKKLVIFSLSGFNKTARDQTRTESETSVRLVDLNAEEWKPESIVHFLSEDPIQPSAGF